MQPLQTIGALPLLDEQERHRILIDWNDTARPYPQDLCLHQLFEQQAARTPDAVAIVDEKPGVAISYAQLNAAANRLANHLISGGVCVGDHVAVCLPRSPDVVIAMLAILKAGATYVPMDPEYPVERLRYMLEDCGAKRILTHGGMQDMFSGSGLGLVVLDANRESLAQLSEHNPLVAVDAEDPAYVIYTSGSTGRPKGVEVLHRGICNHVFWIVDALQIGATDRVLHKTSVSFDASLFELSATLHAGATIVLPAADTERDADQLLRVVQDTGITVLQMVPSSLRAWMANPSVRFANNLRYVICGGEALDRATARELQRRHPGLSIGNFYGPTEASIDATWRPLDAAILQGSGTVPIGRPIANVRCHVLDARLQPVPVGVAGQLYVGGRGLARGYLNRPELTAQAFIEDPFRPGERLYATGDKARYLPTGELEFLGRLNEQVKVRGYRIELGEIESALAAHAEIARSVVVVREEEPGDARLVAYVVGRDGKSADPASLREHLKTVLPAYMVPQHFVVLDSIPLLPNGKTDRKALPRPDVHEQQRSYLAPRSALEESLAQIWSEVLGRARVGVHDSFFDLGGHSLMAMQVVSRIRSIFQVDLALRTLFETPTVARQAVAVQALLQVGGSSFGEPSSVLKVRQQEGRPAMTGGPRPTPRAGAAVVSFSQRRMWLIQAMDPTDVAYNVSVAVRMRGALDGDSLLGALRLVVDRHEAFRTYFLETDAEPRAALVTHADLNLALEDLTRTSSEDRESVALLRLKEQSNIPFDLGRAPLYRVSLLKLADDDHILMLVMHHAISDDWTFGIVLRELSTAYRALRRREPVPLPPLSIDYMDYASWQRQQLAEATLASQERFWLGKLAGLQPLAIPYDYRLRMGSHRKGSKVVRSLSSERVGALQSFCARHSVTPYMVLLACFKLLLSRYCGQDDVWVGTPIANRTHVECENLVGTLVNTLVMRTSLEGCATFSGLLERVKATSIEAFENQDLPFDYLVERLRSVAGASGELDMQVLFNVLNTPWDEAALDGVDCNWVQLDRGVTQFDLGLHIDLAATRAITLSYSIDRFAVGTAERILDSFESVLSQALLEPDITLSRVEVRAAAEQELITQWNATERDFDRRACVHHLVAASAARNPESWAVRFLASRVTYGELDGSANALAQELRSRGVGKGQRVGILVERSPSMVVAQLGILKSGAAYVPLDPAYPVERLQFMAADSRLALIVSERGVHEVLGFPADRMILLDEFLASADGALSPPLPPDAAFDATPKDAAYVIYTSGSTGKPKGVVVPHGAVVNFLASMATEPGLAVSDRIVAVTTLSFDIAVLELLLPLSLGAEVILATKDQASAGDSLRDLLERTEATAMQATPSTWRMLIDAGWGGGEPFKALIGGEALPRDLAVSLLERCSELWNMYGPTETTVWSTCWRVPALGDRDIAIGKPIANTTIYILDSRLRQVPIGVAGEIYIGGEGVTLGYLDRPELTADRFVVDPNGAGTKLYRTGDKGRWTHDGNVEHLGRLDTQVKVRGHRIELGEIETALAAVANVSRCVVIVREDRPGDARIVAYYVSGGAPVKASDLRARLQALLPHYMVPQHFVQLPSIPLLPNGKLDRRALPAPSDPREDAAEGAKMPSTSIEKAIAEIWERLLGVERVALSDNFFELGGHSLLATRAIREIETRVGVTLGARRLIFESLGQLAQVENYVGSAHVSSGNGLVSIRGPIDPAAERAGWIGVAGVPSERGLSDAAQGNSGAVAPGTPLDAAESPGFIARWFRRLRE